MKVVIVGLGYVGLPLAVAASEAGLTVTGLDRNATIVENLNSGVSHIDDLDSQDISRLLGLGFSATTDPSCIFSTDVVVICVPTPLDASGQPDLGAVIGASRDIAANAHNDLLVVLESTTYPGTTDEILKPLLETTGRVIGQNIFLAFSPERIDPGNSIYGIRNTPKIVGGVTEVCGDKAVEFYEKFINEVVRAKGTREAETAKLLENTYRHINIALVNEMAQFCHAMGIDIWNVVELAKTKPFGFQSFSPSAGVGGHCIPIDPNYLAYKVRAELERPFRFVELAEEINHGMPPYVARRAQDLLNNQGKAVKGSKVLLLGVTYKSNISDKRESPAVPLAQRLLDMGATLSYFDPHVPSWVVNGLTVPREPNLTAALSGSDIAIVVQAHKEFIDAASEIGACATAVLDTTGKFVGSNIERL
ncbi:nucleotide sugar dehydrogenase [Alpinimonas psychrophila]|uniref:Nucleotide sugar dehydrogenase n=1 Tax=Alpinimonas psychrophila TaxID=748908 RepID=A0A7W3JU19_9MICO|nr:nucleotide sugar dehydrogenase [Alpinimonas psychrophila]MBA8829258.1 nucleotide sugar dehydrogenase [Alpinimonas psychrophila]